MSLDWSNRRTTHRITSILILVLFVVAVEPLSAHKTKRPFTVADDIGMVLFRVLGLTQREIQFSPDGNYFAVYTEGGCLGVNRIVDSLRFYRTRDVEHFLDHSDLSQQPSPLWILSRSGREGPVINDWRWLYDSSGVVFLDGGGIFGDKRLTLATLQTRKLERLTSGIETVKSFDLRDRLHFAYTVPSPIPIQKLREESRAPAIVGTGHTFAELLLLNSSRIRDEYQTVDVHQPRRHLWAVVGGKRFEVKVHGAPFLAAGRDLVLSPDGRSVIAQQVISDVPVLWETLYPPPPSASSRLSISAGRQHAQLWGSPVSEYVLIDLHRNLVQSLTDAPEANSAGWGAGGSPSWSNDGRSILLPGTFLASKDQQQSSPCVVVVDLDLNMRSCLEVLVGSSATGVVKEGTHFVKNVRFIDGDKNRALVSYLTSGNHSGSTEYHRSADGTWIMVKQRDEKREVRHKGLEVNVEEALDKPPLLVARKNNVSRVILDPNPQLKDIDLGEASLYQWKDKHDREWIGGLYKPSNYKAEHRYPLVIQTHGFYASHFAPAGSYSTANAARELAAAGIIVLQVEDEDCQTEDIYEAPCAVSGYESAAKQLVSEGLVDANRIGITGFSQTCFYVMETLTAGALHIKAASVTDGPMADYWQFLLYEEGFPRLFNLEIGASPFGAGLPQWLKRSPTFNLDKITAPLLVMGEGIPRFLLMWQVYAGLHYLQKPVDLIVLNTHEHVLTNPAVRMASQGSSVDWYRFWLNDEEDLKPAKVEQYKRWRELRKLQRQNESELATHQFPSN